MFRPWGLLNWSLSIGDKKSWQFFGCLGTEERSITSYIELKKLKALTSETLFHIDEPHSPFVRAAGERINARSSAIKAVGGTPSILKFNLLDPITVLDQPLSFLEENVILDITSIPKRYFFYTLKFLFNKEHVKNLMVTYTLPESYPNKALSGNEEDWDVLPTFRHPDPDLELQAQKRLVVNVGLMPDGLISHLNPDDSTKIDLIIPFPAPVAAVQRAWKSVWALTAAPGAPSRVSFNECRVDACDMSEAFQRILSFTPPVSNLLSFAPFGPKPISAAMCLYAALTSSPVYYTQPKVYDPDYSLGVKSIKGSPAVYSYWIKHDGFKLYNLP